VGTPYAVALPGGGLRLFFCGKPSAERGGMCIGALDSPAGRLEADAWLPAGKRVSGSASYLKGMVESPLEFRSGEALDNLTPNLKLLGGAAAVSAALVGGFLAANGVL